MCGEHRSACSMPMDVRGSSPHVRGTRCWLSAWNREVGIIPACAGNTASRLPDAVCNWDHPRMCGEHPPIIGHGKAERGSSPHVRGTRVERDGTRLFHGIIPACAGNTCWSGRLVRGGRDHPRMCGEHPVGFRYRPPVEGSSPHVRGTPTHICRNR